MKYKEDRDIFDVIMSWPLLTAFYPIYSKYKEELLYLFFGGLTFFLSIGIYTLLEQLAGLNALAANIASWIAGVTFAFFTTRKWVFKAKTRGIKDLIRQMGDFCAARIMTLALQEILLFIFITLLGFSSILIKTCTEVINIILNYIASKFIIFKNR